MYQPARIEQAIRRATNASYIDIFDCVNQNRNKFSPNLWDDMLRIRDLDRYHPPREVYYHRTQEDEDFDAAEELDAAQGADDSEQGQSGQEIAM